MKTKNIFRMLLMAVVLLMGANNAMAQGPFAINYSVTEGSGTISTDKTTASTGETVTVTVTPNDGYRIKEVIVRDEWYNTVPLNDNQFVMPERGVTVFAAFEAIDYNITLNVGENGSVNTNKNNNVAHVGDEVELYINPVWSYVIDQLSVIADDGTIIEVANNKFTMPAQNVTVTVTFKTNTTITYSVWNGNGIQNGSVSAEPNYQVEEGTTITLSSTPNEGYELDYYSISTDGSTFTPIEGNTFTMPASNVWVIATFKQTDTPAATTYAVSIANGIQNGSVSANPTNAEEGATVTLTVTPNDGYRLESLTVTDANNQAVTVNGNQFTMPASDVTVSATFAQVQSADYTFTINVTGEGTINLYRETAKEGEQITINAQPTQYYYELGELTVLDAGNNVITVTDMKFTMPASNVTINATFVPKKYTLTWKINGEEEAYLEQQVEFGSTIVEPETAPYRDGYVFNGWGQHLATMPAYDYSITGSFSQVYNITLSYDDTKGTASLSKNTSLGNNEVIYVTVTPAEGYEIASVTATDGNGPVYVSGNYQFSVGSSDVTVTVTFKEAAAPTYAINNYNNSQNGSVWANVTEAEAGAVVTLYNQPSYGYEFDYYVVTAGNEEIQVTDGRFEMPADDVTISGVFKKGTFTISFYVDGKLWEQQTYSYGDAISLPAEPSKDGYRFNGWQGLPQTMPGQDTQVYASFIQEGGGGQDIEDDTEFVNVTVGSTGYTTFCSNQALDVTGLSVYYAVSIDSEYVTLRKLTGVVAAGTGLLVKGTSSIPVSNETGTAYYDNLLVGVMSNTNAPAGAYVLVDKSGQATFAQTSEESIATVPAGKAYLMVPNSGARYLGIKFDDNATGINSMKMELIGDETIYNLRGQRVSNPRNGLYIVNGKKVYIK